MLYSGLPARRKIMLMSSTRGSTAAVRAGRAAAWRSAAFGRIAEAFNADSDTMIEQRVNRIM